MPINQENIIDLLATLSQNQSVVRPNTSGMVIGNAAVVLYGLNGLPGLYRLFTIGTLALEPWRLLLDAAAVGASVISTYYTHDSNRRSIADVLRNDLTPEQRARLSSHAQNILRDVLDVESLYQLMGFLAENDDLREELIRLTTNFVTRELRYTLA